MNIRSYANLLQQHFSTPVDAVCFYNAGFYGPVDQSPCCLVTVHPFCEGGERRLALNAKHPLIIALAKAAASRNPEKQRQAIAMGENLLMTNTWPMAGLDVFLPNQKLHWKTAKGLICGPHFTYISPVPHKEIVTDLDMKSLAIWPRKIQSIQLKADKGDPSSTKEKCVILSGEIWARRDEMLWDEWRRRRRTWEWKNCFLPVSKKLI
eukprot:scaffold11974_cov205-Chaetoceros_neogracile.AAC.1